MEKVEQKWIHASVRLPEMFLVTVPGESSYLRGRDEVLVWDGEEMIIAHPCFDVNDFLWVAEGGYSFSAEWWMPLPTPPAV